MRYSGDGIWLMASLMAHHHGLRPGEDFRVLFAVALLKTGPALGWVLFSGSGFPCLPCLLSPQEEQSQKLSSSLSKQLVVIQVLMFDPNPTHWLVSFSVF